MKKILAIVCVLALAGGMLSACGKDSGGGDAKSDTVQIGVNYELTGDVATYGNDSVNGIKMAIDEVNANGGVLGGKQIELIVKDDKSDPAESTSIEESLMGDGKIVAALGPATSGNFRAVIPIATNYGIPVISSSATADDDITVDKNGNVREFVFRTCFTDSFQGKTMSNFAFNELSAKKAVIFGDTSSDYAKGLAANFKSNFESLGGAVVGEEGYVAKDKDFNSVLTKIKGQDFDVLFVPGYYQEAGLIIKQARELGIKQPILGADGFDSPELVNLAGAANATDIYFSNHYSSLDKDPAVVKFIEDYKAANGTEPGAFIAMGYDLGKYIVDAIERAGAADAKAIAKALAETKEFSGVTGTFSVDKDHNVVKSAVVIKLENGAQVSATRV
ncbi:MAG: ABC transporter substrate-binding protein [Clostridiales Family XIII bacterium]|jgi:branched-chain amino acid transport system substrate-binding protein|nr:ABC transporter substrate-binding protein [Clostridiales Family XIII bacterium]